MIGICKRIRNVERSEAYEVLRVLELIAGKHFTEVLANVFNLLRLAKRKRVISIGKLSAGRGHFVDLEIDIGLVAVRILREVVPGSDTRENPQCRRRGRYGKHEQHNEETARHAAWRSLKSAGFVPVDEKPHLTAVCRRHARPPA